MGRFAVEKQGKELCLVAEKFPFDLEGHGRFIIEGRWRVTKEGQVVGNLSPVYTWKEGQPQHPPAHQSMRVVIHFQRHVQSLLKEQMDQQKCKNLHDIRPGVGLRPF